MEHLKQHAIDGALSSGAVSSPFWWAYLSAYGQAAMLIGGLVLLGIRIALAAREWKRG